MTLVSIGVSIIVAPAALLAFGGWIGSADIVTISETVLFLTLPVGGGLVIGGLAKASFNRLKVFLPDLSPQIRCKLEGAARNVNFVRAASPNSIGLLSVVLFSAAFFAPFESDIGGASPTLLKLLTGWFFILTLETFVWLSMPLQILGLCCFGLKWPKASIILSASALGIALPFLAHPSVTYGWGDFVYRRPQTPELGYFLILGSIVINVVGSAKLLRSMQPEGSKFPPFVLASCLIVAITPSLLLGAIKGATKYHAFISARNAVHEKHYARIAKDNKEKEEKPERVATDLAKKWKKVILHDQIINDVSHGPPGTIPEGLHAKREGIEVELLNTRQESVQVNAWVTYVLPSGKKVICKFFPPNGTKYANNGNRHYEYGPIIRSGEAVTLRIRHPANEFYEACYAQARTAPLELAVSTADRTRLLFMTDTAFLPAPPPHAEWKLDLGYR
jgi:hypothetical protein